MLDISQLPVHCRNVHGLMPGGVPQPQLGCTLAPAAFGSACADSLCETPVGDAPSPLAGRGS